MRSLISFAAIFLALGIGGCAERVSGPREPTGAAIPVVVPNGVPDTSSAGQPQNPVQAIDTGTVVIIIKHP